MGWCTQGAPEKSLTRRFASTSPACGRGEIQLTAGLITPLQFAYNGY